MTTPRTTHSTSALHRSLLALLVGSLLAACGEATPDETGPNPDEATVRAFYSDILSDPASSTEARYYELFSPDVVSIPNPPAGPGAQGMIDTVAFLGQVVPDLSWVPQEVIELDDGRFVVRGLATGTPVGPFFGVEPPTGRSFEIMSIDILTLDTGKIAHVYHLEDWTSAIAQLTAE